MRRSDKQMAIQDAESLLGQAEYGVLSTVDKEGLPYGTPLNYVFKNNKVFFHCAMSGRKLENILFNSKVSFAVVGDTQVVPEKFTTFYESVIVSGKARTVHGDEKRAALMWLIEKYCPEFLEEGKVYIDREISRTQVVEITIDQIAGKSSFKG